MCEVTLKINLHSSESQDANKWEKSAHGYQRQNATKAEKGRQKRTRRTSIAALGKQHFRRGDEEWMPQKATASYVMTFQDIIFRQQSLSEMLLFQNHFHGESTKSNKRKGMRSLEGFCPTVNQSKKQLCRNYFHKVAVLGTVQPQLLIKALVTGSSFLA